MNARVAKNGGQAFGIVLGCLLGMFPLLFIDNERAQKVGCFSWSYFENLKKFSVKYDFNFFFTCY